MTLGVPGGYGANQCEHGSLARSCALCELTREVADLREQLALSRGAYDNLEMKYQAERLNVAQLDEEIARLRELYQDEHDWATAMFNVVDAARGVVAYRNGPPVDAAEALELMDKLAVAVKVYGEGKPQ